MRLALVAQIEIIWYLQDLSQITKDASHAGFHSSWRQNFYTIKVVVFSQQKKHYEVSQVFNFHETWLVSDKWKALASCRNKKHFFSVFLLHDSKKRGFTFVCLLINKFFEASRKDNMSFCHSFIVSAMFYKLCEKNVMPFCLKKLKLCVCFSFHFAMKIEKLQFVKNNQKNY